MQLMIQWRNHEKITDSIARKWMTNMDQETQYPTQGHPACSVLGNNMDMSMGLFEFHDRLPCGKSEINNLAQDKNVIENNLYMTIRRADYG
ncbi:hypothetical protein E2562_000304 [Oryza meyeriana var. granulata]|uniref:Uncharacterized protein n=1 Tax=Oryza meyeriana var. granulata TaxID=110450 RepID=A0A6G1CP52_9ORYZ|nr:hypothetical protein E2562_000304 [Oryza meyeriana var. granulata]